MSSIRLLMLTGLCMPFAMADNAAPKRQHTVLVATVGNDTIAVDRFLRDKLVLEGVLLLRRPQPHTMHYRSMLAPEGRFTQMEIVWRDARGVRLRSASITYGVDSIRSEVQDGAPRSYSAPASLSAFPIPPTPYGMHAYSILDHACSVLMLSKTPAPTELEWITPGQTTVDKWRVRRMQADTIELDFLERIVRMHADTARRMVWLSIGDAPNQTIVQRSESDIDLAKLMASFVQRDTLHRRSRDFEKQN